MEYCDFVKETVLALEHDDFCSLKKALVGEYISFSVIPEEEVTPEVLAEKLCDYFEKLQLKTGKSFDKHLDAYLDNLADMTDRYIAQAPAAKKNEPPLPVPRARKYFEKAKEIRKTRSLSVRNVTDYTRVMMCLFTAVLKNRYEEIGTFDYSAACIDCDHIINGMKNHTDVLLGIHRRKYDIRDLYCSDTCTFIIAIIVLHVIIAERQREEVYHG